MSFYDGILYSNENKHCSRMQCKLMSELQKQRWILRNRYKTTPALRHYFQKAPAATSQCLQSEGSAWRRWQINERRD